MRVYEVGGMRVYYAPRPGRFEFLSCTILLGLGGGGVRQGVV